MYMKTLADLAIRDINSNNDILPGVLVKPVYINSWSDEPSVGTNSNLVHSDESRGYAGVAAINASLKVFDLLAVYGGQWSGATKVIAGVFSQYSIPMCGDLQADPSLSNKNDYPFFFRMYSAGAAKAMNLLLKEWKVTRVSLIVSQSSAAYSSAADDMVNILNQNGVTILDVLTVSSGPDYIKSSLLSSDTRYILCFTQATDLNPIYFNLTDLIGPNYVWIGMDSPVISQYIDDSAFNAVKGFVLVTPSTEDHKNPNYRALDSQWHQIVDELNLTNFKLNIEVESAGFMGYPDFN
ncbi:hypothetical protein HDU82_007676 [Entophlyctis luteolus]|nr:hypothetical protein HDU82_007676 [Entophlyctis luteolus]